MLMKYPLLSNAFSSSDIEEGQKVQVKLIGFDRGKMKLSIKALSK